MNSPSNQSYGLLHPVDRLKFISQPEREVSDKIYCPYCGSEAFMLWLHGHYQCSNCKIVVVSCCESV